MEFGKQELELKYSRKFQFGRNGKSYIGDQSKDTKFGGEIGEGKKGTTLHKSLCVHLQYVPEIYTQQNQMLSYLDLYLVLTGADALRDLCSSKSTHARARAPAYNLELVSNICPSNHLVLHFKRFTQ